MYQVDKLKDLIQLTEVSKQFITDIFNHTLNITVNLNKQKQLRSFAIICLYNYKENSHLYYTVDNINTTTKENIQKSLNYLRDLQFLQEHKIVHIFSVYPLNNLVNTLFNKKFNGILVFSENEFKCNMNFYEIDKDTITVVKDVEEDTEEIGRLIELSHIFHYQMHLS